MGPLTGLRVIEMAGIGPGPFAAMMLADMGAIVLRVDRADAVGAPDERDPRFEALNRGRISIALDLKRPEGVEAALKPIDCADVLIEGFRPGVMERLGLGPEVCEARNPLLVYGRMTGWGQPGPLARTAGHDVNDIALSGALHGIGRRGEPPPPPLNLIGDFGGGAMYLLFGVLAALWERERSRRGQVVDAAILDGAASLAGFMAGAVQRGGWSLDRCANPIDGGRPWYDSYECADGAYVCIGALEPKFYAELLEKTGLAAEPLPDRADPDGWPALRARFSALFRTRTRAEWTALLEGSDACFAPVLDVMEAMEHPQNLARGVHVEVGGVRQPAPAPRFSRSAAFDPRLAARAGSGTRDGRLGWGMPEGEADALIASGAAVQGDAA